MTFCPAYPPSSRIPRCSPSICDCFIDIYPDDDPGGIHPEAFVVTTPAAPDDTTEVGV